MDSTLSKRTRTIIMLLSIGIHAIALLIVFSLYKTGDLIIHSFDDLAEILSQSPNQQPATVIIQDPPLAQGATTPQAQPQPMQATPQQQAITNTPTPHEDTNDRQEPESDPATHEALKVKKEQPRTVMVEKEEPAEPEQKIVELPKTAGREIKQLVAEKKSEPVKKAVAQKQEPTATQSGAPNLTLADLAQGFLKSMEYERGHMPQAQLDAQTLLRQQYSTKVWTMLKHSFKANRNLVHLNRNLLTNAVFVLRIARDGALKYAALEHPNKTQEVAEVENVLVNAARTTGLYPPVPQQFNVDTLTLQFPLHIKGEEGFHNYELFYGA